ncbi:MAG: hypothetical protein IKD71_09550 [Solobacterium sp.]|nr:hypothetical protein [Solobacterium sp.]
MQKKRVHFEPAFSSHVSIKHLSSISMRLLCLQNACLPVYWQKSCHSLSIPSSFPDESPQTHYEDEKYGVHYANHRKQSHEVVLGSADNNHRSDPPSFFRIMVFSALDVSYLFDTRNFLLSMSEALLFLRAVPNGGNCSIAPI